MSDITHQDDEAEMPDIKEISGIQNLIKKELPALNNLENILTAQQIISARISTGIMDPVEGKIIMQSLEILRDGFIQQAKLHQTENDAISQSRKDAIDAEFNQLLLSFCDEFQEMKRTKSP